MDIEEDDISGDISVLSMRSRDACTRQRIVLAHIVASNCPLPWSETQLASSPKIIEAVKENGGL